METWLILIIIGLVVALLLSYELGALIIVVGLIVLLVGYARSRR